MKQNILVYKNFEIFSEIFPFFFSENNKKLLYTLRKKHPSSPVTFIIIPVNYCGNTFIIISIYYLK